MIVQIEGNELVIRIDKENLSMAARYSPVFNHIAFNDKTNNWDDIIIDDVDEFTKEILYELKCENDNGDTILHDMFDKAFLNAYENGSATMKFIPITDRK